jgi:hypothetical protein
MSRKSIAFAAALLAAGLAFVGMLSNARAQGAAQSPPPGPPALQISGTWSTAEKIKSALEEKTSLEFVDMSLKEALKQIGDKHHLDIQYDVVSLRDAAIDPTAIPVNLDVKNVRLLSALKIILSQNNLTYLIQDGVLAITTKDRANTTLTTTVYDVRDLLPLRDAGRPDFQSLTELLTSEIAPQTWSNVGGPGTVAGFGLGSLIVSQTQEVHEEIANLLRILRGVAEEVKLAKISESALAGRDAQDLTFEQSLDKKTSFEAAETPLTKAMQDLFHAVPINVAFDVVALRDAAIDPSALLVSGKFKDFPLRSILKLILNPENLTYVVQDEAVLITTKDKANTTLTTRVYPVNDLLKVSPSEEPSTDEAAAGINALLENIRNTIAAQTWAQVGGPGTIDAFDKNGYMLVVSQTGEVHEEISDLLKNLRTMHHQQLDAAARDQTQAKTPENVVLKVYDLRVSAPNAPAMTPQEVMEVVKGLTEAKTWNTPDAYIRGATGKLIVKQTPSVHRQIEKLLDQLGAAVPKMPTSGNRSGTGFGGGGGGF